MQPLIRNLGIILSLSVLFSCHKPHNDTTDHNDTKLRISRVVQHIASRPANESMVIDFLYDDQQRVDKMVFSNGDQSSGTLTVKPLETFNYYYNGTEKNSYKATNNPFATSLLADTYYKYNNAGQLIEDSLKFDSISSITTRDFTYFSDKILVKKSTYNAGAISSQIIDSFVIKDDNLVAVFYGSSTPGYNHTSCYRCTYDKKINPVYKLNLAAWTPTDGIPGFPSYLAPGASKNNIVEYSMGNIDSQGNFYVLQTAKLSYTYNNDGLPETCTMTTKQDTYTVTYYYE